MALSVIDDLQQELPVVIINFLCSQSSIIVYGQQVSAIHLEERRHTRPQHQETFRTVLMPAHVSSTSDHNLKVPLKEIRRR